MLNYSCKNLWQRYSNFNIFYIGYDRVFLSSVQKGEFNMTCYRIVIQPFRKNNGEWLVCFTDVILSAKYVSLIPHGRAMSSSSLGQRRADKGVNFVTLCSAISLTYLSGREIYGHVWFQVCSWSSSSYSWHMGHEELKICRLWMNKIGWIVFSCPILI